MDDKNPGYDTHLFICTNSPDKPGKCGSKGSEELRRNLKERCRSEFGKQVRINASGCLGHCEHGIAAVLYKDKAPLGHEKSEWFLELNKDEGEILYQAIKTAQGLEKKD